MKHDVLQPTDARTDHTHVSVVTLSGGEPVVGEFRTVPLATSERRAAPGNPKVVSVCVGVGESVCEPGEVMEAD